MQPLLETVDKYRDTMASFLDGLSRAPSTNTPKAETRKRIKSMALPSGMVSSAPITPLPLSSSSRATTPTKSAKSPKTRKPVLFSRTETDASPKSSKSKAALPKDSDVPGPATAQPSTTTNVTSTTSSPTTGGTPTETSPSTQRSNRSSKGSPRDRSNTPRAKMIKRSSSKTKSSPRTFSSTSSTSTSTSTTPAVSPTNTSVEPLTPSLPTLEITESTDDNSAAQNLQPPVPECSDIANSEASVEVGTPPTAGTGETLQSRYTGILPTPLQPKKARPNFGRRSRDDNDFLTGRRASFSVAHVTLQENTTLKTSNGSGSVQLYRTSGEFKDFKVRRTSSSSFSQSSETPGFKVLDPEKIAYIFRAFSSYRLLLNEHAIECQDLELAEKASKIIQEITHKENLLQRGGLKISQSEGTLPFRHVVNETHEHLPKGGSPDSGRSPETPRRDRIGEKRDSPSKARSIQRRTSLSLTRKLSTKSFAKSGNNPNTPIFKRLQKRSSVSHFDSRELEKLAKKERDAEKELEEKLSKDSAREKDGVKFKNKDKEFTNASLSNSNNEINFNLVMRKEKKEKRDKDSASYKDSASGNVSLSNSNTEISLTKKEKKEKKHKDKDKDGGALPNLSTSNEISFNVVMKNKEKKDKSKDNSPNNSSMKDISPRSKLKDLGEVSITLVKRDKKDKDSECKNKETPHGVKPSSSRDNLRISSDILYPK